MEVTRKAIIISLSLLMLSGCTTTSTAGVNQTTSVNDAGIVKKAKNKDTTGENSVYSDFGIEINPARDVWTGRDPEKDNVAEDQDNSKDGNVNSNGNTDSTASNTNALRGNGSASSSPEASASASPEASEEAETDKDDKNAAERPFDYSIYRTYSDGDRVDLYLTVNDVPANVSDATLQAYADTTLAGNLQNGNVGATVESGNVVMNGKQQPYARSTVKNDKQTVYEYYVPLLSAGKMVMLDIISKGHDDTDDVLSLVQFVDYKKQQADKAKTEQEQEQSDKLKDLFNTPTPSAGADNKSDKNNKDSKEGQ